MQRTKGDAFSLLNIPVTLPIYLWQPNIEFKSAFPWAWLATPARDLAARYPYSHFDGIEPVGSLPFSVPALFLSALAGSALCFLRSRRDSLRAFRAPLVGAFAGIFLMLTWGYITYRYMQDALPWLAFACAIAVAHIPLAGTKSLRYALTALLIIATVYGVWVNVAFAVVQKRIYAFPEQDTRRGSSTTSPRPFKMAASAAGCNTSCTGEPTYMPPISNAATCPWTARHLPRARIVRSSFITDCLPAEPNTLSLFPIPGCTSFPWFMPVLTLDPCAFS
jgi:hypothetical protein